MTLSRDIEGGPHKPFGSAIRRNSDGDRVDIIPIITERPIRPRFGGLSGRCAVCGDRYFGCGHDPEDEE